MTETTEYKGKTRVLVTSCVITNKAFIGTILFCTFTNCLFLLFGFQKQINLVLKNSSSQITIFLWQQSFYTFVAWKREKISFLSSVLETSPFSYGLYGLYRQLNASLKYLDHQDVWRSYYVLVLWGIFVHPPCVAVFPADIVTGTLQNSCRFVLFAPFILFTLQMCSEGQLMISVLFAIMLQYSVVNRIQQ